MPKFFVNSDSINDHTITLEDENAKHIGNVLRNKIGDVITVCDGQGRDYECEITEITKKTVIAKITDIFTHPQNPYKIYGILEYLGIKKRFIHSYPQVINILWITLC